MFNDMLKGFFLLYFVFTFGIMCAQSYDLKLCIEDRKYDSICIFGYDKKLEARKIYASPDMKNKMWFFSVPDTLFENLCLVDFQTGYNKELKTFYAMDFKYVFNGDTILLDCNILDRKISVLHAKYINTVIHTGIRTVDGIGRISVDNFLISYPANTEWSVQGEYPMVGAFCPQSEIEKNYNYEDYLNQYVSAVRKYPNSRYLLSSICRNKIRFEQKNDLLKLYFSFTDSMRLSDTGLELNDFINKFPSLSEFSNYKLPVCETGKIESIVQDTSKYNLIIFSASWCGACHKQIPLLKKIFQELGKELIISYVSLDDLGKENKWRELMKAKEIPWRSLLAGVENNKIREKYHAYAIPQSLLIYPGGKQMEVVDVRKEKDRMKLYELVKLAVKN